jgi:hypothetical protein
MPYGKDPVISSGGGYGRDTTTEPNEPSPWHQLWEGLKRDVIQAPQVAAAKAPQIGRDLAQGATGLVSDVGRSLLPGRQGAAAGGRVLGKVGDIAALASGGFAGPTMPPAGARAPVGGTLRATPEMRAAAGAEPALASAEPTPPASPLATAMVKGDQATIDRHLTRAYRRAVKPGRQPFATAGRLDAQDRSTMNAVDSIIANKDDLKLTDANDREMRPGELPKTLHQFMQGIDQRKEAIFNQYDEMAARAGGQGVKVPLQPAIDALMQVAHQPEVLAAHPGITATAERFAKNWAEAGALSPKQMQKLIQNLNATYAGPSPTREIISERTLIQPVMQTMRATLNQAIESSQGPGYQPLKKQYGDLLSIERDVANAVQREAKNIPGGLGATFANLISAGELLHGVILMEPRALATAASVKGAQMALRWAKSPNRAVQEMFAHRARQGQLVPLASAVPGAMGMTQTGFVGGQGDTGPNGGRIIARTTQ